MWNDVKHVSDFPEITREFSYSLNEKLPENILANSWESVWWKCHECDYIFKNSPYKRIKKNAGCPNCREKKKKHLSDFPEVLEDYAYDLNEETPDKIRAGSGKKLYWRCHVCGHVYTYSASRKTARNVGCPECREKRQKYLSDYPNIVREYAQDLNEKRPEELTAGSDEIVSWRCSTCEGVYLTSPYHKTKGGTGCPFCKNQKVLTGYNDLKYKRPDLLKYWDYETNDLEGITPDKVVYGSAKKVSWICEKGHKFQKRVEQVYSNKTFNCPECTKINMEINIQEKARSAEEREKNCQLAIEEKEKNRQLAAKEKARVVAEREERRQLAAEEKARIAAEREEKRQLAAEEKARVAAEREEKRQLAAEEKARIAAEREEKRQLAAEEKARIAAEREEKRQLENKEKQGKGVSLPDKYSSMFDEIKNEKNGLVKNKLSRSRAYDWKCDKGHEWKATIERIISQDGCPICNNEKNTIASKHPELIDLYDTEKNGGVSPEKQIASGIAYFWWKCKEGHSFLAQLEGVLQHKNTGCMYCDKDKSIYSIDGWMGFADENKG